MLIVFFLIINYIRDILSDSHLDKVAITIFFFQLLKKQSKLMKFASRLFHFN